MTAAPSDPAPPVPLAPPAEPLPSPLDVLEALRREGKREFIVRWTGENGGGWTVRWVGPVVRRGENVETKG